MSAGPARRRYRGATPEERDAERRRRLLDAALDLFGTNGWNKTSIEALCRTAGVTTRHFYALFNGREELFIALYDERIAWLAERLGEAVAGADRDAASVARAAFGAIHDLYDSDRRVARVMLVEVLGISEQVEAHRRAAIDGFVDQIAGLTQELIDRGELQPVDDLRVTTLAIVGAATELLHSGLGADADAPSRDAAVDELVRLYLLAFGAEVPQGQT
jgi:AcrR family transcriptional regulator